MSKFLPNLLSLFKTFGKRILMLGIFLLPFISKAQTADFTISLSSECGNGTATFTDISGPEEVTKWAWNFGNSNYLNTEDAAQGKTPSAIYPGPGVYTVSLSVNDGPAVTKTITIYPNPEPDFSPSATTGCEPMDVVLTATAKDVDVAPYDIGGTPVGGINAGTIQSYQWDFQGKIPGVTQNNPVLSLTGLAANEYGVLLLVTDEHGCEGTIYEPAVFTTNATPTGDFTITKKNACGLGDADFEASAVISSGSISEYQWDINNDGTIEDRLKTYTHTFSSAGTFDVSLTLLSDAGCTSSEVIKQIQFNDGNSTDFTYSGSCVGQAISFTDASSASATTWSWDFNNDGNEDSNQQNPNTTFTTAGDHLVSLKVTHSDACEMEVTKTIRVKGVTSAFTYETGSACPPNYTVSFTDASTTTDGTIVSWSWDFDGDKIEDSNLQNPIYNFTSGGIHPVKLTVSTDEGCSASFTENVVVEVKSVNFSLSDPSNGCEGLEVNFSGVYSDAINDPVTNWDWTFENGSEAGTGQNPSHTYNTRGEYSVGLTITTTNGCSLSITKDDVVEVGQKPVITAVTHSANDCVNNGMEFTSEFTGLADSLYWSFSDGGTLRSSFNDGDSPQKVDYHFTDDGVYTLTVTALDNGCPSDPFVLPNIIINQPVARFSIDDNIKCSVPAIVNFTNTSDSDAAGTTYTWDFGDGNSSNETNPSHTYSTAGDYTVKLTVYNPETACTDEFTQNVVVTISDPQFVTDKTMGCHPASIAFTNQIAANSSANFQIGSIAWDFDNNGSIESNNANPNYTYASPDLYDVKMTVTEARGCVYSVVKNGFLSINGPVASFTKDPTEACLNQEITFTNTTTKDDNDPADVANYTYEWNFGDGTTSTLENPTHTYTSENNFTVSLKVSDENGCSNTISENNSVIVPNLTAGFTTNQEIYCVGESVTFNNTASIVNGSATITQYEWDLDGDGLYEISSASSANPSFVYTTSGTITIKQKVTSSLGCPDETSKEITIVDGDGSFTVDDINLGCAPAGTTFRANDDALMVSSYLWDFGDGKTATSREPLHFYVEPGSYEVRLTVTLTGGCVKTTTQTVKVAGPVGNFSYNNLEGCADPNHEVTFEATNMKDVTELTWDYGIGVTKNESIAVGTTQKSITYDYTVAGTKLPILILTDDGTCGSFSYIREDLGRINTSTPPNVNFSKTSGENICENVEFQFTDQSTLTDNRYQIVSWSWDFDEDGVEDSNQQHPKYTYTTAGTYDVRLTVTTSFGCTATLTKPDFVSVVSPDNLTNIQILTDEAELQNHKVCPGESILFTGSATSTNGNGSIYSWHWDFGDGLSSASQIQNHVFGSEDAGTTNTVTLTVTDNSKCVKSTTVDISIYKVEADFSITSSPVLRGNTISFTDLSTSKINGVADGIINAWVWTFEEGTPTNSNVQNPIITYNKIGSGYEVSLTAKNDELCADNITKTVDVLNNPPLVSDFSVTGLEDTDVSIPLADFDSKFDTSLDDTQQLEKVKIVSLPEHGKLLNGTVEILVGDEINRADLTDLKFRPDANWNGSTSFDYNAYDAYDYAVADATITINVTQVEDAPVITSFSDSQNKDVPYSIQLSDFLDNFSDVDYDVDNNGSADVPANDYPEFQKMKITVLPTAAMGILKLNGVAIAADQEITKAELTSHDLVFEPADGFIGDAIFTWNASDGAMYAAIPATVTINYYNQRPTVSSRNFNNQKENSNVEITRAMFVGKYSDADVNDKAFKHIKITQVPSSNGSFKFRGTDLVVDDIILYDDLADNIYCQPSDPNFNGTLQLRWNAFDGTEYAVSDTYINVKYINTPPVVYDFSKAPIAEDTQVTFVATDFSTEDTPFKDEDTHDALVQIRINSLPSNGTLKLSGSNVAVNNVISLANLANLTYDPNQDYNGADSFQWYGYDGTAYSALPANVNLTILPIQDKPTVANISKSATEDDPVQITKADFVGKFSDVDKPYQEPKADDLEKIKITRLPDALHGTLLHNGVAVATNDVILVDNIDLGSGLVFVPVAGYEGNSSFDWNGSDGVDYADANATVTITHNNTKPVVSNFDKGDQLEDVVITFTRTDFENHYSDANITDTQFEKINIISLPSAGIGKFTLDASDLTTGEYTYAQLLNGVVFTPNAGANGIVNLVWNGFDGTEYASSNATFSFTYINSVPTVSDFSKAAVNEDNNVEFETTDFTNASLGNYADVDVHDTFDKIQVTDLPDHGTLEYGSTTVTLNAEVPYSELGSLKYVPNQHWFGNDSFKWKGHDGTDYSAESTVSITINSVNDAPIADNESVTTLEDQTHDFTAAEFSNSYSDNYFSENSAFAGIRIVSLETAGYLKVGSTDVELNDALDLTDIDNLVFSTDPHENGTTYATFGFKVFDGEDYSTSVYTMTVNVTPVNDIPTFSLIPSPDVDILEDKGLFERNIHAVSLSKGPNNESSQTLSFNVVNNNNSLFSVQPAIDSNGKLTFTTAANQFGTSTVTVVLKDNGGTSNGGVDTSVSKTFTITINAVNDHPVADNEAVTTNEDVTYTFAASNFSNSYSDIENEPMTRIQITEIETVGDLEYDNADVIADLEINTADITKLKLIPVADQHGSPYSSFKFKVFDGTDYSDSEYTMTVNVLSVNDEPSFTFKDLADVVVNEDHGSETVNGQVATQYAGAANESGQALTLHVSHTNSGLFAANPAIDAAGTLTFTTAPNAHGVSTVSVYITDNGGTAFGGDDQSDPQQFTITINSINDIPTAADESVTELEDETYAFKEEDFSDSYNDVETAFAGIEITGLESTGNLEYNENPVVTGLQIAAADIVNLKFIPNADENGNNYDSFTYKVYDGEAYSASSYTMNIHITPVNDKPTFALKDAAIKVDEDSGAAVFNGQLINQYEGAANENAQSLTIHISNNDNTLFAVQPAIDAGGDLSFTPADDAFGTAQVSVYITDNGGTTNGGVNTSDTETFTITINAVNDPPVAKDDNFDTDEDVQLSGNLKLDNDNGLDTDVDSDPANFTYTIVDGGTADANGSINLNADGTFTYDADADYFGTVSFTYQVCDDASSPLTKGCDQASVTITVNSVNDTPVAVDDSNTTDEDVAVNGNVLTNDTNLGDAPVEVVSNTNPSNGSVTVNSDGTYTYTPNADFFGTDTFEYTIEDVDGEQSTATVTITVNATNDTPVAVDDSNTTDEDVAVNGNVLTNDTDLGDAPVEVVSNTNPSNGSVSVNSDGTYTYTPNKDFFGTDTFTYTIRDKDGEEDTATVTITVNATNDTPVAVNDSNTTDEDVAVNGNVLTNDTDLGDAPVTVVSNTNPSNGSVSVNSDGTYTYTPNTDFFGTDSFDYTIEDVDGEQSTATVTITVNATNDTPVAVDDSNTTDEDVAVNGNVLTNDTDLGDAPVTVVSNSNPSNGSVTVNSDGTYTYTPNKDFFGTDTFTYTIRDKDGEEDTATVTITVNATNDTPVAVDDSNTTDEDVAVNGNVLTNDTDLGDAPVTVVSNSNPSNGSVSVNADGTYTYTPNKDFFGTDTFEYTIEDVDGETSTAKVTITVNPTNDTPVAVNDTYTTNEDESVSGNVLTNDSDLGDAPVVVDSFTNAVHGTVTVNADGSFTYTPNTDFFGTDNFNYTIKDVDGDEDFTTVIINVLSVDDIPVAVDDTNVVDEDASVSGNVLTNDTNLGDAPVKVVSNTNPANGTVSVDANGDYTYTPNADFFGTDSFNYTIEDVDGDQSTATVTITVNPTNDTPLAVDDSLWLKEDSSKSGNVFDNDERLVDVPVVISANTDPSHGTLVINADGTFTYTPTPGYFGNDSFTYTLRDMDGDESTATVNIWVDPLDYNPIANDDSDIINEDETSSGNLFANDEDFINTPVVVVSNTDPANGTVIVNSDGTYTYTPNTDFFGTDTFTYTLEDVDGDQDTATVTITVNPVNDTPVAVNDAYSVDEDDAISGNLMDNDTNLGDVPVIVVSNTNPSNGSVTVNADGTFTYTPNADFFGTDTFTYTIEDVDGEQSTATVTITVNSVNDLPIAVNDINVTDEDTAVSGNVLTNDTHLGDAVVEVVDMTHPAKGIVVINPDGTYTYTPEENFNGTDAFTYTIEDANGDQSTATVTITVNPINDLPVAINDTNSTDENTSVSGNVLSNDTDIDLDDLTVVSINGNAAELGNVINLNGGGTIVLNADGSYEFNPNGDFDYLNTAETAQVSFTYVMNDGDVDSNTATVVITIIGVNDAPVAEDDFVDTKDNEEINIIVKDNDSDADGDELGVEIISNPEYGEVVVNEDGTLTYIADLGAYCQTDQFTYRVCDPEGLCDEAIVTIEIGVSDSDEDSIPDAVETLILNSDDDADLNYQDLDSDNDGISDEDEAQITDPCTDKPIDTDGDGTPDYLDTDSDNDGYPDKEEGDDDCDGDGIADYIDAYDDCGEYVSIPEGFSPNGDGVNDRFVIKGIKDFPNSRLMIFNRWGNKIFEATGYLNDWDGRAENGMTVGSEVIPEGTYYYIIDLGNGDKPIKGFVYINY